MVIFPPSSLLTNMNYLFGEYFRNQKVINMLRFCGIFGNTRNSKVFINLDIDLRNILNLEET